MRTTLLALMTACVAIAGASPRAAQGPAPAPQAPTPAAPAPGTQPPLTFKVDVNYVEIDAQVVDGQGNFVRYLSKDDFQLQEDGKPQALSVFSKVDIPIERVDPPLFSKTEIPPDVYSNERPADGRLFVLVLDDLHTRFNRTARTRMAARQFVERYVGANDLVAVVNTSGYSSSSQDFTSNRALALRAIDRAMGQKADSATSAALDDYFRNRDTGNTSTASADSNRFDRFNKARNTASVLKNLSDYLAGIRGRRKAMVFFSEGIDYDTNNVISDQYASDVRDAMQDAIAAATRANVAIYSVDPRGVTTGTEDIMEIQSFADDNSIGITNLMEETRIQHDNMRVFSEQTGGFAVLNQNDFRNAFARILDDNSSYYVLGYYPTNDKRDGKFRNVQVKVNRPGLTVRTRKGYVAPQGKADTKKAAAAPGKMSPELRDAMNSPVPVSGLTLSVFAAPFRGTAPKDAIAIAVEIDGSRIPFKEADGTFNSDLEVSMYAADAKGKIQDGSQDQLNLHLKPSTYQAVSHGRFRILKKLQVPPGKYSLRVGAHETNGNTVGSVFLDLDVPDFSKGPLTMSGIVVSSASGSQVPTRSSDPSGNDFKDVLPAPPTALREFPRGDQLAVFTEIYDNLGSSAHGVGITATVLSDAGASVFTKSDQRRSEELKGSVGGYGYTTTIPTSSFPPGRYVLRIEAKATVGKEASVTREVEFRVR